VNLRRSLPLFLAAACTAGMTHLAFHGARELCCRSHRGGRETRRDAGEPGARPAASSARRRPSPSRSGPAMPNATAFGKIESDRLAGAQKAIDRLIAVKGARTIDNTLVPYDEALQYLDVAGAQAQLMETVHPDSAVRAVAEELTQDISALGTKISLDRRVYDAIAALDVSKADAETQLLRQRELRDFKLAGVDKDEATRAKITALRDTLVKIGQDSTATSAATCAPFRWPAPRTSTVCPPTTSRPTRRAPMARSRSTSTIRTTFR
jgi:hypothetical protein